jgi:two-component system chemotaxis response regulator CheB
VPKIRVLVVDDSVVFRRMVAQELGADPGLEVVGTAANGRIALAKLAQVCPDIVILDVEMPELDGLATLREVRKTHPRLPVVMFSAATERGAVATLDALAAGATGYFAKPSGTGGLDDSLRVVRTGLIPEIKAICAAAANGVSGGGLSGIRRAIAPPESNAGLTRLPTGPGSGSFPKAVPAGPDVGPSPRARGPAARVDVVCIGTSTGGPTALYEVFAALPADLPVPLVVVQHMPPEFTRMLAERLTAHSGLAVKEGQAGDVLVPGRAWVAPGDFHMAVTGSAADARLALNQDAPENSCRPAADVLFRSVAQVYGPHVLAVVMTGMGQDGLRGCEAIKAAGGQVIVQDEATSVVWGMPGIVARSGLADKVLGLSQIAPEIARRVRLARGDGK